MAVAVDISWVGRDASDFARLYRVGANIRNFKPVLKDIGDEIVGPSIAKNFLAGGRPTWAPLSPETTRTKRAKGHSDRILVATGAMEQAASNSARYSVDRNSLEAWPRGIPYWEFHQTGTQRMPQRVIMLLQQADRTAINRLFANYFRTFMTFSPGKAGVRYFRGP